MSETRLSSSIAFLLVAQAITLLGGCGMTGSSSSTGGPSVPPAIPSAVVGGKVHGGQQPIAGATAQLWAAGTSGNSPAGYGANATLIATTTTDSGGNFSFDVGGASPCATGQLLYITAAGGNAGGGTNNAIALMAALPTPCNPSTGSQYLVVNEVSTAASVTALQQFLRITSGGSPAWQIGAPSSNFIGLVNAFAQVGNLVNVATGNSVAFTTTSQIGGNTYTTTITPDSSKLDTFADILASCINSSSGSSMCGNLFTDTTPSGLTTPADTIQVAYYMATDAGGLGMPSHGNATGSPSYLCTTYVTSNSPFPPSTPCNESPNTSATVATTYPTDWTIGVSWSASNGSSVIGTVDTSSIALDGNGNVWTSPQNSSSTGGSIVEFNSNGQVIMAPVTHATLAGGWYYSSLCPSGCSTSYALGGNHTPDALVIDSNGSAWASTFSGAAIPVPGNPDTFGSGACAAGINEGIVVQITNVGGTGTAKGYLTGLNPASLQVDASNNILLSTNPTSGPANSNNDTTGTAPDNCKQSYYLGELASSGSPTYSTFNPAVGSQTAQLSLYYWSTTIDQTSSQNVYGFLNGGETTIPYVNHLGGSGVVGSTTPLPSSISFGVADASGNLWTSNSSTLYYVDIATSTSSPTINSFSQGSHGATQGGLGGPRGMAVDGAGHLWVANAPNGIANNTEIGGGLSEFSVSGSGTVPVLTPMSPSGNYVFGYGSNVTWVEPVGAAIDASGNVWVKTIGGNTLNYIVGIAAPVTTRPSQNGGSGNQSSLQIETSTVPTGTQMVPYTQTQLIAAGGTAPLTWSIQAGALPAGLTLSTAGLLSGTPTSAGNSAVTVQVTDSSSPQQTATATYNMYIQVASIQTLSAEVAALPTDDAGEQAKKAVLQWGITEAQNFQAAGDSTDANNLLIDVSNNINTTFTPPSTLPTAFFPAIPEQATNACLQGSGGGIAVTAGIVNYDASHAYPFHELYNNLDDAFTDTYNAGELIRAYLYPGPTNTNSMNAAFIPSFLNRLENAIYTRGSGGQFSGDFTAAAETPYDLLMLMSAWPQLVLPSRAAAWEQALQQDEASILAQTQAHFLAAPNDVANNWINADVRWLGGIAYNDVLQGNPTAHSQVLAGALAEMAQSIQPDGGTDYTDQQNENATYHYFYTTELERYSRVMNDQSALNLAKATEWWTVLSIANPIPDTADPPPPGVLGKGTSEYITANSWHKYWNQYNDYTAMAEIVGLTGDPYVQWQVQREGWYGKYYFAPFYRSTTDVVPLAIPTNQIVYDENILGPRGQQGTFSFVGTTRATPVSRRGKATFVGTMIQAPFTATAPNAYSLDSAVESIGVQVVNLKCVNPNTFITSTPGSSGPCVALTNATHEASMDGNNIVAAANEFNAQTTTSTFGAVSSVHNLSGYNAAPTSWVVSEIWLLLPTRTVGLVQVQNTSNESAYRLQGAVRFISGIGSSGSQKTLSEDATNDWVYGNTALHIWENNFGGNVTTQLDNTWEDTAQKAEWLRMEDPNSSDTASSPYNWAAGTNHYFLAEIHPTANAAATNVSSSFLSGGLISFQLTDGATQYIVVDNPTATSATFAIPSGMTAAVVSGTEYRPSYLPADPNYHAPNPYGGTIPPYSHVVFHN